MKINLRFAKDEDGPRVAEMAKAAGFSFSNFEIDWSRLEPYWLVAEVDDRLAAAIQILPALPIGRMDYLIVDPSLGKKTRGVVVLAITDGAAGILKQSGCQIAGSYIASEMKEYLKIAQKRGWTKLFETNVMFRRLTT